MKIKLIQILKLINPSIFLLIFFMITGCEKKSSFSQIDSKLINPSLHKTSEIELKNWHFKDIVIDTLPGISLQRAYDSLLSAKKGIIIIVAVIDTEIDINHKDLVDKFWINKNEIPNNKIDDDKNGYIDDVNGWNFIGNQDGYNIIYSNLESIRIIQEFKNIFQDQQINEVSVEKRNDFRLYLKATKDYKEKLKMILADKKYADFLYKGYPAAIRALKLILPEEQFNIKKLDSIYDKYKIKDDKLAKHAYFLSDCIKYNLSKKWIKEYRVDINNKINKTYNQSYFEKDKIDSHPKDINFDNYGNKFINKNIDKFYHGTLIAGVIAAKRNNNIGIDGVSDNIKIMPISISSNGEENDKDIAVAIKYAVNNGAKVINMSFGKNFSLNKEWLFDALKYAEQKDVLIVSSAGNSKYNLNEFNNYYPNDNLNNEEEISDNFLLVGSISSNLNNKLLSFYSNHGNLDVDVFAPGQDIYTTLPNNKYKFDSGTSLSAAITSGVAALLFSYFPSLTASQVKHILMDSGLEYTMEVNTPTKEDKNKTTPFNKLSKSGKVLNAYNALIMADNVSRN